LTPGYFFRPPFFFPLLYPELSWRVPTTANEIYLTFDDGPVPGPTEFVLDQLDRVKAPATFFLIGDNIRKNPAVFKKILQRGHAFGNHTYHHVSGWKMDSEDYLANAALCDEELDRAGAPQAEGRTLFRPPYGRITRRQIAAFKEYKIIMWDVLTNDYAKNLSPEKCLLGALGATRPGSIVVFHDSLKAEKNLSFVLPRYLDRVCEMGYALKRLP